MVVPDRLASFDCCLRAISPPVGFGWLGPRPTQSRHHEQPLDEWIDDADRL